MIGAQQQQEFAAQGFVALRGVIDAAEVWEVLSRVLREEVPRMPPEHKFYEQLGDPSTLKQLQHLQRYDEQLARWLEDGPFRLVAEALLGPVVPQNLQYFSKPPRRSQPTPPHQDGFYFMLEPCEAVTMWLALDAVDESNGCVRYVAGSQRRGLRPHTRTQTLGFSQGIVDYPSAEDEESPVVAQPGDLLVHHALTIHRADANESDRPRRALGFIYYSARSRHDRLSHAAYQQQLAAEWANRGRL